MLNGLSFYNDSALKTQEWKRDVVANDLSRKYTLPYILEAKVLGFHSIQVIYIEDPDF